MSNSKLITVKPNSKSVSQALLLFSGREYICAIGAGGVRKDKVEGDLSTPVGTFPLRCVLFRPDRLKRPETGLNTLPIEPDDIWCDDPKDNAYNTRLKLPTESSYENLWREENIYDIVVPIGYNDHPPIPKKGSAIFIHIAHKGMSPTHGCVALDQKDLLEIIERVDTDTKIKIDNISG